EGHRVRRCGESWRKVLRLRLFQRRLPHRLRRPTQKRRSCPQLRPRQAPNLRRLKLQGRGIRLQVQRRLRARQLRRSLVMHRLYGIGWEKQRSATMAGGCNHCRSKNVERSMTSTQENQLSATGCAIAFDNGTRQLYATDASLYQIEPAAVA